METFIFMWKHSSSSPSKTLMSICDSIHEQDKCKLLKLLFTKCCFDFGRMSEIYFHRSTLYLSGYLHSFRNLCIILEITSISLSMVLSLLYNLPACVAKVVTESSSYNVFIWKLHFQKMLPMQLCNLCQRG